MGLLSNCVKTTSLANFSLANVLYLNNNFLFFFSNIRIFDVLHSTDL